MQQHLSELSAPTLLTDPSRALDFLRADGAVRVKLPGSGSAEEAKGVARSVFGSNLKALPEPARVFKGGEQDRHQLGSVHQDPLIAHTDGFSYGDFYPDYILLNCVHASPVGGESFLVDGYRVLETLASRAETQWVTEALATVAVDQTEEGMQSAISPIVQRTGSGRLMVRRTLDELGNGPVPAENSANKERDAEMIRQWELAIEEAVEVAPRFQLASGETLVADNYRMIHGREGYDDPARMMWRVWVWTNECLGVPEIDLHSDSRFAHATG